MSCTYCQAPIYGDSEFCCHSCELLYKWNFKGISPLGSLEKVSARWHKYSTPELESTFNISECPLYKRFHLYINGLQCSSCVHLLEDFPLYCEGVVFSQVDFSKCTFDLEVKNSVSLGKICEAIAQLGYEPKPLKELAEYKKAQSEEKRSDLKRIGVAGAVAGNVMLLSTPLYTGVTGSLSSIFKWLSFLVFLPVVTYLAIPFYKKAWASLLVRRSNVDMMIVVALLSGFILSSYALILGTNEIYFDSTASVIFLIITTRYFLKSNQAKLDKNNILQDLFDHEVYILINDKKRMNVSHSQIISQQTIEVQKYQLIPCDAILKSPVAEFDFSYLTGESSPQTRHAGELVAAGSRLLTAQALFLVQTQSDKSQLAESIKRSETFRYNKQPTQSLADVLSHKLTLAVLFIAALFFTVTYEDLGIEAFKRCLALITIACPCAIAFGTPLAHSLALKKASRLGYFIRSESLFEKIGLIKKVIFDKTGTLTLSEMKLVKTEPFLLSNEEKEIILGLEKNSMHPVAISLKAAWPQIKLKEISNVTEIVGLGVESVVEEHKYALIQSQLQVDEKTMAVQFLKDNELIDTLFFHEQLRPESKSVVSSLKSKGIEVSMLTGDQRIRALEIGRQLGISEPHVFSEQTLESKKQMISRENPCLFVGDGINDIAALTEATIGFAVKGPFESTFRACDVYAPQKDLNAVVEIFDLAKQVQATVKTNLGFALAYNIIGGAFALAGFINPLVAAVLMPLSSFLITSHTVWRLK